MKVGQKRRHDQIKNIASEIEKKQKDDQKLVVSNKVADPIKTEEDGPDKKKQKVQIEEIDLMTPCRPDKK